MSKQEKIHFFIVDDDKDVLELSAMLLEQAGHRVTRATSSKQALNQIIESQPDCVLSDLIMPDLDGFDLYYKIKKDKKILQPPKFILVTSKTYDFDKRRASQLGINGYITKPINPDTFLDDILKIVSDKVVVKFYGVRGTLPVPGKNSLCFGGNTNCLTLELPGGYFFIFDGGTGIKSLSDYLLKERKLPLSAKIFITHPHWDHINGLPFFAPFYIKGNEFEIFSIGHEDVDIQKMIFNQMNSEHFPVTIKEFAAKLSFRHLKEEEFDIDDIHIQTMLLIHPGRCLGYRVQYKNKLFCYITDNELYLEDSPYYNQFEVDRLIRFIYEADILIIDATYTDDEYLKKINWGHSSVSRVVEVANKAKVKLLCLHHHDLDENDSDILLKLKQARSLLKKYHSKTRCIVPHEGDEIII